MIECLMLALIRALSRCVRRITLDNAAQISEAISRNTCHLAVMLLPGEAKEAFRNEVLNHLLESVWDDHKRGISPELMVSRAMSRALTVLFHAPGLRNDYRIIACTVGIDWTEITRLAALYVRFPVRFYRWRWESRHRLGHRVVALVTAVTIVAGIVVAFLPTSAASWPFRAGSSGYIILTATAAPVTLLILLPYMVGAVDLYMWLRERQRTEAA